MPLQLDHVVVVVPSLVEGEAAFRQAGFTVTPGGWHEGLPTENALVAFADGSYLELLAARDAELRALLRTQSVAPDWGRRMHSATALGRRFLPLLAGPDGVADVVLHGVPLARFAREARSRGHVLTGPTPMQRVRPDGVTLAWQLVLPEEAAWPFLIEDVTPRGQRVPGTPEATAHRNGARGLGQVNTRGASVAATALAWADLYGVTPRLDASGETHLMFGTTRFVLAEGEPVGAHAVQILGVPALTPRLLAWGMRSDPG